MRLLSIDPQRSAAPTVVERDITAIRARQPATGHWLQSTRTSVHFDPRTPYQLWAHVGAKIAVYANAAPWWLGDWLAFGRMKYGRRYRDAVATTGLDYQTLRNYAVVARRFEHSRRRDDLSFQHHAELCSLSDEAQDRWLEQAARHGWSRNELRRHVRLELRDRGTEPSVLRFTVAAERSRRWRDAAALGRVSFDEWALHALDAAAASAFERTE